MTADATLDLTDPSQVTPDRLCAAAVDETQLTDFGPPSYLEGLGLLSKGLQQDIMTRGGRKLIAETAVKYLANRLRVIDHHQKHPELASAEVKAPIVILGLPRTGTTAISYLLGQDPRWRSLLNWEAIDSVPPATTQTLRSDPRCTDLLEFQKSVLPLIDPPPPHWEWADGPTECTFLLAQDFKAAMWESRVPNPEYRDFIAEADMTSAYDYHRSCLQVLQSEAPGTWCLKMPAHAFFIEGLLNAYPDARIVWTHRDPATATASFMNLLAFSHTLSLGAPDAEWIASTTPGRLVDQVARPMAALAGRDVHHLHYSQYLADPMGEVRRLYDWLGADLTGEVTTAMTSWLDEDPLVVSRQARYSLDDFGLDRKELYERFSDYIEAFDIALDSTD